MACGTKWRHFDDFDLEDFDRPSPSASFRTNSLPHLRDRNGGSGCQSSERFQA